MTEHAKPRARIKPARPAEGDESRGYMPRIPWRWVLLGALSVGTIAGGYFLNQRRKAEQLRAQIVRVHEQELAEPARRYLEFRDKLEGWITTAAQTPPKDFADDRLRISGLRSGKGLYLRLPLEEAKTRKGIRAAAAHMEPDTIASCLGIAPASAGSLWEKGHFLTPEWLKEKRKDERVMQLRVTDTVLARHIKADLPVLLNMLRSDWFLLVLQHGDNRRDAPVDAVLWDIKSGQQLLRGRIQASGVLLSARVRSKDAPSGPALAPERHESGAAHDCSIAAQIKELAGIPAASVHNVQPAATGAAETRAAEPGATAEGQPAPGGSAEAANQAAQASP
jgi:hypothetical protein